VEKAGHVIACVGSGASGLGLRGRCSSFASDPLGVACRAASSHDPGASGTRLWTLGVAFVCSFSDERDVRLRRAATELGLEFCSAGVSEGGRTTTPIAAPSWVSRNGTRIADLSPRSASITVKATS